MKKEELCGRGEENREDNNKNIGGEIERESKSKSEGCKIDFVSFVNAIKSRRRRRREINNNNNNNNDRPLMTSLMDNLMGLLRIRVKRGVNLAVRDVRSSDPYVVVRMGKQKLKTRVIKKDVNPEWNEDLTLSITDPNVLITLVGNQVVSDDEENLFMLCEIDENLIFYLRTVFDHDTFSKDDRMGDVEFEIRTYIEALKMNVDDLPTGTIISKVQPSSTNCLSEESCIVWKDGRIIQDLILRLRNVECGELEIQLQWIDLPGSKGL